MTGQNERERERREQDRLAELDRYQAAVSEPAVAFDELVTVAAAVAGTPMAAVSLVGQRRQHFPAAVGLDTPGMSREVAFCDLVVQDNDELVVGDTLLEPRLAQHPDVVGGPRYRFYAGFPLRTPSGAVLGTLCVFDQQPRSLTGDQLAVLRVLAAHVMAQLQLRHERRLRDQLIAQRQEWLEPAQAAGATEQELVRANDLFDQLLSSATEQAIIGADTQGRITIFNRGAEIMLGYSAPEMLGRSADIFHDPEEAERLMGYLQQVARAAAADVSGSRPPGTQEVNPDWTYIHKDGHRIQAQIRLSPMRDAHGQIVGFVGIANDVTRQRQSQAALAAADADIIARTEQLEQAQQIAAMGSWSVDQATGTATWSKEMHRILGTDPVTFVPTLDAFMARVHPEDAEAFSTTIRQAIESGTGWTAEHRLLLGTGEVRNILCRGKVDLGSSGQPIRVGGISQDITGMRRAQRELIDARDTFHQVIDASTEQSIFVVEPDAGPISVFNSGAERMLGYSAEEAIGSRLYLQLHLPEEVAEKAGRYGVPPDRYGLVDVFLAATQAGDREWTLIRKDGSRREVLLTVNEMRNRQGELTGYLSVASDVTLARRVQRELMAARDQFVQLLGAATDQAIVGTGLDGRINLFNGGAARMLGYTPEEAFGQSPWRLLHDQDELASRFAQWDEDALLVSLRADLERGPIQIEREWIWVHQDGHRLNVQVSLSPMRDQDGDVSGYLCIATDVTDQRAAERERDAAEAGVQAAMVAISAARDEALAANQAKSAFLATMSHEIRTPMNAVIGMTGLLLDTGLDEDQRDLLETVRGSGDQLLAIINDILDFSKIEAGDLDLEYRSFDLRDLVEGTVAQFAGSAQGLDLLSQVDDSCPAHVIGDVTRLRQVLSNLISNAVKFTTEGEVLVQVTCDEQSGDQREVRFLVRDTGIGIPEESMDRLFKSFSQVDASTTRTHGGTGLGLAISRALVNAMGGEISVTSTAGEGSAFAFSVLVGHHDTVPAVRPGRSDDLVTARSARVPVPLPGEPPPDENPSAAGTLRILMAEDNEVNQKVGRLILAKLGYQPEIVDNGELALEAAHQRDFDVILMDMHMPMMDGLEATRRIRAELPPHRQPRIVALTASVTVEDRAACAAAGMDSYLSKPVRPQDLAAALEPRAVTHG